MSLGLGEFAVFLEGDALAVATKTRPSDQARIDELKKQNEDAKYMTKYTRDLEKFTPTKEKPKWVFGRPKFPRIKRSPMDHAEELKELPGCGHTCPDCINNYKSYWEEKAYSKEMDEALKKERATTTGIIDQVQKMEKEMKEEVGEAKLETSQLREMVRNMESQLDLERKLRADDVYRREKVEEELKILQKQHSKVENQHIAVTREVDDIKQENRILRAGAESAIAQKDRFLNQTVFYEEQVNRLERSNADLKVRMREYDIENSRIKLKNDELKDRIKQVSREVIDTRSTLEKANYRKIMPARTPPLNDISRENRSLAGSGSITSQKTKKGYKKDNSMVSRSALTFTPHVDHLSQASISSFGQGGGSMGSISALSMILSDSPEMKKKTKKLQKIASRV